MMMSGKGDAGDQNATDSHEDHALLRQPDPLRDHLGTFDTVPTSGGHPGEGKYAEDALQEIYAVTLVAISDLEQKGKRQQAQHTC